MTTESHRGPPREDTSSDSRRAFLSTAAIGTAGALASVTLPAVAGAHSGSLSFSQNRELHKLLREGNREARSWDANALNGALDDLNSRLDIADSHGLLREIIAFLHDESLDNSVALRDRIDEAIEALREERRSEWETGGIDEAICSRLTGTVDFKVIQFERSNRPEEYRAESRPWYATIVKSAIAGAIIGSRFGWQGALIGALVGAVV